MLQQTDSPLRHGIQWLCDAALPLWTGAGWDERDGMFVERLTLDGEPLVDVPRRVMVQARQVFVMAVAARRGWLPGADRLLDRAAQTMVRRYHGVDDEPGWAFAVGTDGSVDFRRDLYAHAFVLLALASAFSLTRERHYRDLAATTLSFLDGHMASSAGGYVDSWPDPTGHRRQNPHMHLFEAMLAWQRADPDADWLRRADGLLVLLERQLMRGEPRVLVEHFGPDWALTYDTISFEPGHHFEWVWLLDRFSALGGRPTAILSDELLDIALRHGIGTSGRIHDEVEATGRPFKGSARLWPHAEAAKAMTTGSAARLGAPLPHEFLATLHQDFLDPARRGSWIDRLDQSGGVLSTFAPASSLYHLVCAYDELDRVATRLA